MERQSYAAQTSWTNGRMNKNRSGAGIGVGLIQTIKFKGINRIVVHSPFLSNLIMSERTTVTTRNITELSFEHIAVPTPAMTA